MKKLQNCKIIHIFIRDLRRIMHNVVAVVVAVGITILPALYAWFNLAANWDPYANTSGIKVAVSSEDTGTEIEGLKEKINVGDEIIDSLKQNDQIGWTFVDSDKAKEGVKSGKYYAALIIPKEFSEDIISFLTEDISYPDIQYYVNEKKNAIAPKITDTGITVVQKQINQTFVKTATETVLKYLNIASAQIGVDGGTTIVDRFVGHLRGVDKDLSDYETSIDSFTAVGDSVNSTLKAARLLTPDITAAVNQGNASIASAQDSLSAAQSSAETVTSNLGTILDTMQTTVDSASATVSTAMVNAENGERSAAGKFSDVGSRITNVVTVNNQVITNLQDLNRSLPVPLSGIDILVGQLQSLSTTETTAANDLNNAANDLNSAADASASSRQQAADSISEISKQLSAIRTNYSNEVNPQINQTINSISTALGGFQGVLSNVDTNMGKLDQVFVNLEQAMTSGSDSLGNTKTLITSMRTKIQDMITQVEALKKDEQLQKVMEIIQSDPDTYGDYMAAPVSLNTVTIYGIENYGSSMTPFYTILAIWVGGIVLVAIMKVAVDEDDEITDVKPYQSYFGRYLIFFVFGQLQSLIICLGDLLYLGIQCKHPGLFILAGSISSFIFTILIYTLVVSFGAIGKALSVIFLVLQIAGSGGTYPVEVLPEYFQVLNRYFPFTYGMNMMRETIGGMYKYAYWTQAAYLLCFLSAALLLGLVIRKPIIRFTNFFEERLEESKLL